MILKSSSYPLFHLFKEVAFATQDTKFKVANWNYVYQLLLELAEQIKESGFKPDIIVGISRGGWIPARILSDLLDNNNLANIRVEFYTGIYETKKKPIITQPLSLSVKDKRALIVDDIVDTGESAQLVYYEISKEAKEVRIAALYRKSCSSLQPDYCTEDTDSWIIFPWELYETIKILRIKMLKEGKNLKEIKEKLIGIGLNANIVNKFEKFMFWEKV